LVKENASQLSQALSSSLISFSVIYATINAIELEIRELAIIYK
jgi:hypothetical protein